MRAAAARLAMLGAVPTAAWAGFRRIVPFQGAVAGSQQPIGMLAAEFLKAHAVGAFYPSAAEAPLSPP